MEFFVSCCFFLAVTGGVGCGKSSVLKLLKRASFETLETDRLAHRLMTKDEGLHAEVVAAFGEEILLNTGEINRAALADVIFTDAQKRQQLNELMHPVVREEMVHWMKCRSEDAPFAAVEVPLLFECGWQEMGWQCVMAVRADEMVVKRRLQARGWSEDQIEARMGAQWSLEEKCRLADVVIDNSGTEVDLKKNVSAWIKRMQEEIGI
jgi:dephospho-CoA kinase